MIQGTTSDAGKSAMVTGLCRILKRHNLSVVPFKPQNMALNSAVTAEGGEIGRAQAVQAYAAGLEPHVDMNPILLKPNSDTGAQVIVHGKAISSMEAKAYHDYKKVAMDAVLSSHQRLQEQYQHIIVEGAGSPAEINLREGDIANMGFAEAVDCPVVIVADIDRGGVFAHCVGTLELLSPSEQQRVKGFIINRFRGDIKLLEPGLDWLEERTGKKVFGVIPYINNFHLEAEDALSRDDVKASEEVETVKVVVPVLPRISNHTDFDPLRLNPQFEFEFIRDADLFQGADLIILPGSKNVRSDLEWLRASGWTQKIARHCRFGGKLIGICGGYQMLGKTIKDPLGIESAAGESKGLGLLDVHTTLEPEKQLTRVAGEFFLGNVACDGYEIHVGVTEGPGLLHPTVRLDQKVDGAVDKDQQVFGTYLHGIFEKESVLNELLKWLGRESQQSFDYREVREQEIERLADVMAEHLDMDEILKLL